MRLFSVCQWAFMPATCSPSSASSASMLARRSLETLSFSLDIAPLFDFQLEPSALELIDLSGQGVDLDPQA